LYVIEAVVAACQSPLLLALKEASLLQTASEKAANLYRIVSRRVSAPTAAKNHDVEIAVRLSYLETLYIFLKLLRSEVSNLWRVCVTA